MNILKLKGKFLVNVDTNNQIVFFPDDYNLVLKGELSFNNLELSVISRPSQEDHKTFNPLKNTNTNTTGKVLTEIAILSSEAISGIRLEIFLNNGHKIERRFIKQLHDCYEEKQDNQYFYRFKMLNEYKKYTEIYQSYYNNEEINIIITTYNSKEVGLWTIRCD